jgi:hypothetical protein
MGVWCRLSALTTAVSAGFSNITEFKNSGSGKNDPIGIDSTLTKRSTCALTNLHTTGVAVKQAMHSDSGAVLARANAWLEKLGIGALITATYSSNADTAYLHLTANERLHECCPDLDTSTLSNAHALDDSMDIQQRIAIETLLAMTLSPEILLFDHARELISNIRMRLHAVNIASRTELSFDTSAIARPQAYWVYTKENGFLLRQGVSLAEGLERALCPDVSGYTYAFSCQRASEYLMLYAVVSELRKVNKEALLATEAQWRKRALTGDDFLFRFLEERGTRDNPMPMRYYIPGDRIWFKNPDDHSSDIIGFEGSWVIYLGGGRFCNLWDRHRPYTLEEKCLEIYYWSQCVEVNSAGLACMNEVKVKEYVMHALADPGVKDTILKKMMVYRDPTGVYADGGCIDLSRDSFTSVRGPAASA